MITPGLYRHYKGNLYRVLLIAEWTGVRLPVADETLQVGVVDGSWLGVRTDRTFKGGSFFELLSAQWSGNKNNVDESERVVIYVSLSGTGRVSARTVKEFEETVPNPATEATEARFERIGE